MSTFLQIMGGIFLFIIIAVVAVILYFRFKWLKLVDQLSLAEILTPFRIHTVPDVSPDWLEEKAVDKAISAFHSLGFTDVGPFRIEEMPMIKLFGLIHTQEQVMAVVYKHESVGTWSDVVVEYESGEEFTVSNAPTGEELDTRPDVRKLFDETWDEIQLFRTVIQERKPGPFKSVSVKDFPRTFEKSYAEDMAWRNRRGTTKKEIRRVAGNMDIQTSKSHIDEAYAVSLEETVERLNEECIQQFIETTDMSVSEWEKIRDRIFIIHEKIPPNMLPEYVDAYIGFSEDQIEEMESLIDPDMPVCELFQQINESLPDDMKSRKVGEVSEPVRGDIYVEKF
ncbi:hypothetical protein QUF72_17180 [Desulfobacterales bacterium HSG2]|nr:hypothetical protein [Desulfobacterales bacterium HSG2]